MAPCVPDAPVVFDAHAAHRQRGVAESGVVTREDVVPAGDLFAFQRVQERAAVEV